MNPRIKPLSRRPSPFAVRSRRAFTLIELMIVVAIMGVILATGAPTLYKMLHKEGFRKTVSDIVEVCGAARMRAIMMGVTSEVVFRPRDGRCEVAGDAAPGSGILAHTATIEKETTIEMLDVNLREYRDAEEVRVRFFPNGTCDEMTLIMHSNKGEQRGVSLEITTGLATILNEEAIRNMSRGRL